MNYWIVISVILCILSLLLSAFIVYLFLKVLYHIRDELRDMNNIHLAKEWSLSVHSDKKQYETAVYYLLSTRWNKGKISNGFRESMQRDRNRRN